MLAIASSFMCCSVVVLFACVVPLVISKCKALQGCLRVGVACVLVGAGVKVVGVVVVVCWLR